MLEPVHGALTNEAETDRHLPRRAAPPRRPPRRSGMGGSGPLHRFRSAERQDSRRAGPPRPAGRSPPLERSRRTLQEFRRGSYLGLVRPRSRRGRPARPRRGSVSSRDPLRREPHGLLPERESRAELDAGRHRPEVRDGGGRRACHRSRPAGSAAGLLPRRWPAALRQPRPRDDLAGLADGGFRGRFQHPGDRSGAPEDDGLRRGPGQKPDRRAPAQHGHRLSLEPPSPPRGLRPGGGRVRHRADFPAGLPREQRRRPTVPQRHRWGELAGGARGGDRLPALRGRPALAGDRLRLWRRISRGEHRCRRHLDPARRLPPRQYP